MSKLIKVHEDTYEQLTNMKLNGETYDEVICRVLRMFIIWKKFISNLEKEKAERYDR